MMDKQIIPVFVRLSQCFLDCSHHGNVASETTFVSMWAVVTNHAQTFLDLPVLPLVDGQIKKKIQNVRIIIS